MSAMLQILKDAGMFDDAIAKITEEKRDRRNDLAKEAMKIIIADKQRMLGGDKYKETAIEAHKYADAMLAASGDYDDK